MSCAPLGEQPAFPPRYRCNRSEGSVQDVRAKTLQRAAEIMGGEIQLALHLGITPSHLALWMRGLAETPDSVFLDAVDIVLPRNVPQRAPETHT